MRKSVVILIVVFALFTGYGLWADSSRATEQSLRNPESEQISGPKKSSPRGGVGRFQAVRMDDKAVFILDTRRGHSWVFNVTGSGFYSVYAGQIHPGKKTGEVINSSSLKPQK